MIERASELAASSAQPTVESDTHHLTAGDMLRQAREAHGLQIDVVAAALKVPVKKLQALEDDDIAALPDPVFARALAASIARALHIDPAPVLAKLPGAARPGLADADQTISSHIRSGAPRSGRGSGGWQPSRAVWIFVALLLVGAAALLWLPSSVFDHLGAPVSRMTSSQDGGPSASALPSGEALPPGTVVEPAVAAVEPSAPPALAASAPVPGTPAAVAPVAPPTSDALVFVAREDSWVTVNEAGGKQLLRRTIKAGETVGLSGALPLSVVIGRASGVSVQVQGKPFDLAPVTKSGGVARFEVKP